jgi:nucleotide-binding universal stress UspA family protein
VDDVRTAVVPAPSVPTGLVDAVQQHAAELLVLGASAEAPDGRFGAGSVAERLLHSSPVPLALPPRGWDDPAAPARLTCAWAGTARSGEARAQALARRWGVPVRLVTFVPERAVVLPSETGLRTEQVVSEEWAADVQDSLGEGLLARGAGWAGALAAVPWEPGDVLVVASSRSGPPGRVFLGSTAAKVLRASPVPVLVVGRAADDSPTST